MDPGLAWFQLSDLSPSFGWPSILRRHRKLIFSSKPQTSWEGFKWCYSWIYTGCKNENHARFGYRKFLKRGQKRIRYQDIGFPWHFNCFIYKWKKRERELVFTPDPHFYIEMASAPCGVFWFSLWSFPGNLIYLWHFSNVIKSNGSSRIVLLLVATVVLIVIVYKLNM